MPLNRTSPGVEPSGKRVRRAVEPLQVTAGVEREAGVVAAAVAGVRDVDQIRMDSDADRLFPPDQTGLPSASTSLPSGLMRSTEIWLLPASTASRYRPSGLCCNAPWEPVPVPVPAPPTENGDPASGVSVPSACRSNPATVFVPAVLSLTYRCPTTSDAAAAPAGGRCDGQQGEQSHRQGDTCEQAHSFLSFVVTQDRSRLPADGHEAP